MLANPRSHSAGILTTLLLALVAAPAPGLAAEEESAPAAARRGPPEEPGQPDEGGLERSVARQLARLDERLGFGTFPNGSPLWPARMAAAIDYLAGPSGGDGELPGGGLLRRLAADLRRLGVDRGLGGPPEEPGRPPVPPRKERAERLRRVFETVRLLHQKLDRAEAQSNTVDRLAPRAAPANDQCASAQAIGTGTFTGSTTEATNDGTASCGSSSGSPDVWYVFTAPSATSYTFDTFGSSFDTVLSLRTECPRADGRDEEIACNDDADGTLQSKLTRAMAAGESVWIRMSGFGGAAGAYSLHVTEGRGIAGTVTRQDTGTPLAGVEVEIYDSWGWFVDETVTASDGTYTIGGLSTGSYRARSRSTLYLDELYDDIACSFLSYCDPYYGTPISVGSGITRDIDFALAPGGAISGTLTDSVTAAPLAGYVYLYDGTGDYLSSFYTGADGTFEIGGVLPGKYFARAEASGHRAELYDDIPCSYFDCTVTSGTQIQVTAGAAVSDVDFALDPLGGIGGTIIDEESGGPAASVELDLYDDAGDFVDWRYSAGSGAYSFNNLEPGTYFVRTFSERYVNELYDDVSCSPSCPLASGTPVDVAIGVTTSGIDFSLVPKGRIAGVVTEAGSGSPLAWVDVSAHDATGFSVAWDTTAADGSYRLEGLESGSYFVRAFTYEPYQSEIYDDVPCTGACDVTAGTPVATDTGVTTTGVDFALRRLGSISGRVTHAVTGSPLSGISVRAYDPSGYWIESGYSGSDGTYEIEGIPTGSYRVGTENSGGYRDEMYDDLPCGIPCNRTSGVQMAVELETTITGIDFALDRYGTIQGTVTAADTGAQLPVDVYVLDAAGNVLASDWAYGGIFEVTGVPAGNHYVKALHAVWPYDYQDEVYSDLPCEPDCDLSLATPLPVQLNGSVVGVNLTLTRCPVNSYDDLVGTYVASTYLAEACERVSAENVTISSNADATFRAGRTIVLGDGFKVEAGASFRAVIEPAWSDD